jgi:ADP-ribosylglycohydrolase
MLGAIAGDIIGSVYEWRPIKTADFLLFQAGSRFTDDSVLTVAVAQAILTDGDYASALRSVGRRYPNAGYGGTFIQWLHDERMGPYNSWGNGSAMRVSPVGWAYDDAEQLLAAAEASASVSHNHPEGIKGAQAVALAVYRARMGASKEAIREETAVRFQYDLSRTLDEIRPGYSFDVSCQGSVPEAIIAFLESDDYETAVRLAISLGGDSDTMACIAGAIAEAFYGGVPPAIAHETRQRLPADLLTIVDQFYERFI